MLLSTFVEATLPIGDDWFDRCFVSRGLTTPYVLVEAGSSSLKLRSLFLIFLSFFLFVSTKNYGRGERPATSLHNTQIQQ